MEELNSLLARFRLKLLKRKEQHNDQESIEALEDAIYYCKRISDCFKDIAEPPPK